MRRHLLQGLLDLLAGIDARRVVVAEVVDVGGPLQRPDLIGCAVQKGQARVAAGHHQRYIVSAGDGEHDAGQSVLLEPYLDIGVCIGP